MTLKYPVPDTFEVDWSDALKYQHQAFIYEYLIDMDCTRASNAVHIHPSTGAKWLERPEIAERIMQGLMDKARRNHIDANYVIDKLTAILETSLDDFLVIPEFGAPYYDLSQATRAQRAVLESIEITTRIGTYDQHNVQQVIKTKLTMPSRLKAIELLGKHVDVQAFRERIDVTMHSVEEKLLAGRKRALLNGTAERVSDRPTELVGYDGQTEVGSGGGPASTVYKEPTPAENPRSDEHQNNNPTERMVSQNNSVASPNLDFLD